MKSMHIMIAFVRDKEKGPLYGLNVEWELTYLLNYISSRSQNIPSKKSKGCLICLCVVSVYFYRKKLMFVYMREYEVQDKI